MKHAAILAALALACAAGASAEHVEPPAPLVVSKLSASNTVSIYADLQPILYGRSPERAYVRTVEFSAFESSHTFPVAEPEGILTGVVVDVRIETALTGLLLENWYVNLGELELFKQYIGGRRCYTYRRSDLGIEFTFSLEPPPEAVLDQVRIVYRNRPDLEQQVLAHYRANRVVRVFSAENVTNPGTSEITYDEALLMATLIGDPSKYLLGFHDGAGALFEIDP